METKPCCHGELSLNVWEGWSLKAHQVPGVLNSLNLAVTLQCSFYSQMSSWSSILHLTVLQSNFSRGTSAPNAHKTEEILSTSGHESTTPCSGIAITAHGITHSFLFGTEIDTSSSSLTALCTLSNKNKGRIGGCL